MYVYYRQLLAQTIFPLLLITPVFSSAQVKLSNSEIFHRCYMRFFKSVVPRTDSLAKQLLQNVQEKKISGPDACVVLLEQSEFADLGVAVGPKSNSLLRLSEKENQELIRTFHSLHNSFFTKKALEYVNKATDQSTYVLRDLEEPSLYFTRALFGKNVNIRTVFTSTHGLKGVRVTPKDASGKMATNWESKPMSLVNETIYGSNNGLIISYGPTAQLGSLPIEDNQIVPFGKLIGVAKPTSKIIPEVIISGQTFASNVPNRTVIINEFNTARTQKLKNVDLFEHLGGGLLGSQIFIMKNTNLTVGQIAPGPNNDKDHYIARRMSARIFEDLLCHQLPTLDEKNVTSPAAEATESEIKNFVQLGSPHVLTDSPHGFRQSASCMACHTSLDPMAYVFKNFVGYRTSLNDNPSTGDSAKDLAARKMGTPIGGILAFKTIPDAKLFTLQNPTGGLNYRDHNGNTVTLPVNGLKDLGIKLSESDDFFRCTVKRYYHFLTGYDVRLNKLEANDRTATVATFHRDQIFKIAANLKKTGSMKKMIEDILKSEAFIYRNYQSAK